MTDRYENIRRALADMDAAAEARNGIAWRDAHARFVVHVPPDTIRELLAERDQLAAKVEALRAEVGELHMHAKRRDQYAVEKAAQALDWKKRAERLAAVLALLERSLAVIQHDIDEIGGCDHSVGICCCELIHLADDIRAALAQENRNG